MSFSKTLHLEDDIESRVKNQWEFYDMNAPLGQKYAVLCVVAPTGCNQTCDQFGIKVFGCFPTLAEANAYCKELVKKCDAFDYYTMETQQWVSLPPNVASLADRNYQEQRLEDLKNAIIKHREASKQNLKERYEKKLKPDSLKQD